MPTKDPRRAIRLALGMLGTTEDNLVGEFCRRKDYLLNCSTKIGVPMARDCQGGMGDKGKALDKDCHGFSSFLGGRPKGGDIMTKDRYGDEE